MQNTYFLFLNIFKKQKFFSKTLHEKNAKTMRSQIYDSQAN
jgi:hypothetical protein